MTGSQFATGTWTLAGAVDLGHFNNDNLTDVFLYASSTGTWQTQRSNGSGGWSSSTGTFTTGKSVLVGHFNGDRWTDLLLYTLSTGGVTIRLSEGGGTFASPSPYSATWQTNSQPYVDYFTAF